MADNTVKKYIDLFRLKKVPNGTIYEVEETGKCYIRNNHNWDEMQKAKIKEATGPSMKLYEINQNSVMNLPSLSKDQILEKAIQIDNWAANYEDEHYMLLSHNFKYYTIFAKSHLYHNGDSLGDVVTECISNFPIIYSFDYDKENNGGEIWACLEKNNKVPEVFYLFPYEAGVINYG
jgi:hypothetical protein